MTTVNLLTRGARELGVRFDEFPAGVRERLKSKITALSTELHERIQEAAYSSFQHPTGKLQSEITLRVFDDSPTRIAGYVSVFAPGIVGEYAKAATLEYGSDKPRRAFKRDIAGNILKRGKNRIVRRLSSPVQIRAYRYLRGPAEAMRAQVQAAIVQAATEAAQEPPRG